MSLEDKVRKLIVVSGSVDTIKAGLSQIAGMVHPDLTFTDEEVENLAMLNIPVYSENFTEQEIDDALAWWESESGKAFASRQVQMVEKSKEATSQTIETLISKKVLEIEKNMTDELTDPTEEIMSQLKDVFKEEK